MTKLKWYFFDKNKGSRQKRPTIYKWVLVLCRSKVDGYPDPVIVGYRKDAAGDKQSPYFVVPGGNCGEPYAWCDCLPEETPYPPSDDSEMQGDKYEL
jgi:hypothetical protein